MVQNTAAGVHTYSLRTMADFRCKIVEMHVDGMLLRIDGQEVWVGLVGRFNAYNLLAVYGAAVLLGLDRAEVLRAMSMLHAVSGRFEFVRAENGTTAIVDYAHTPDALENVIQTIQETSFPQKASSSLRTGPPPPAKDSGIPTDESRPHDNSVSRTALHEVPLKD